MSVPHPDARLYMVREHLESLPQFPLPPGIVLRWFLPGDDAHWVGIQAAADSFSEISPDLYASYFGSDQDLLHARQCFLVKGEQEFIGTATAWFDSNFEGGTWGRVHWVAVIPKYQGCGLSKLLMTAVCTRLMELGHTRAYLVTNPWRWPAIRLYLNFGFRPHVRSPTEAALWQRLGCAPET